LKKLTPIFLMVATFSLIFLSFFIFPIQIEAKTRIETEIELDKNSYSTTETVKIKVKLKAEEDGEIKSTRIRLQIFDRLAPGTSVLDYKTKGKRSIFRRTWYESITDEEGEFNFEKDLSKYNIGEGVYPVELNVDLENGKEVSERTFLIIMNERKERLRVFLVWNWHLPAKIGPNGILGPDYLEEKIGTIEDPGTLLKYSSLLRKYPDVKINLAISPALLGDISSVSNGYRSGVKKVKTFDEESPLSKASLKFIGDLKRALSDEGRVDLLEVPFGYPSLPTLLSLGWKSDFDDQIKKGAEVLKSIFKRENKLRTMLFPGLSIDQASANRARKAGIDRVIMDPENFKSRPRNNFAGPYDVSSDTDVELESFSADTEFLEVIAKKKRSDIETYLHAIIAMRLLSYDDKGAVVVIIDGENNLLDVRKVEVVMKFIKNSPWIKSEIFSDLTPSNALKKRSLVEDASDVQNVDNGYLRDLKKLRDESRDFYTAVSKDNKVSQDIKESLLAAQSFDWISRKGSSKSDAGEDYLDDVESLIDENYSNILIEPSQAITFSGKKGKIPVAILNKNNYPIYLTIKLDGGKDFSFSDDKSRKVKIMPKENLLVYKVDTHFRGLSTLNISLLSGNKEITSGSIDVSVSDMAKNILNVVSVASLFVIGVFIIRKRVRARGKDV